MLTFLRIRNLATIEDVQLDFRKGLTILTGETGVGKSIIIDGIRLALGEKGETYKIRSGEKELVAEAVFTGPLGKNKSPDEKDTDNIYIQRIVSSETQSKAYLNGIIVPIKKIKEISESLIDIFGQNDHVFLREKRYQLNYLDESAGLIPIREEVQQCARKLKQLIREKSELESKEKERERKLDFLEFQINEIKKAQLGPGEEEELFKEREILRNAEQIQQLVEETLNLTDSEEISLTSLLAKLKPRLQSLEKFDSSFKDFNQILEDFSISLKEFSRFLIQYKEKHSSSPEKLDAVERRLNQIDTLKRKYGDSISDILKSLKEAEEEYSWLSTSRLKLQELTKKIEEQFSYYNEKVNLLSQKRKSFSKQLSQEIEKEVQKLGMEKAKFLIDFKTEKVDLNEFIIPETGIDEVEFLISPNPGEEAKPLRKIASGGELSRLMLALKIVGEEEERGKTLIFDEIDAGIGGRTAESVSKKLKELAEKHQVICITHLPQIASSASQHYKIDKKISEGRTFTIVKKLDLEERVEEIARLTVGSRVTETSLKNAREMLLHHLSTTE